MKPSIARPMNEAHRGILWDSFEELVKSIGERRETLDKVTSLFTDCVLRKKPLNDGMKRSLIEALQ